MTAAAPQVLVQDRSVVETADAETRVVAPAGLQAAIDAEVAKVTSGEGAHPAAARHGLSLGWHASCFARQAERKSCSLQAWGGAAVGIATPTGDCA